MLGAMVTAVGLVMLAITSTGGYARLSRHALGRWLILPCWPIFRSSPSRGRQALRIGAVACLLVGMALLVLGVFQLR
jgi:hypothetical protein